VIGRLYTWRGRTWRVLTRWLYPERAFMVCSGCGRMQPGCTLEPDLGGFFCLTCGSLVLVRRGCPRNVLIEDVETGERVVRPFRGLRRAAA
jgi:hypothetical protein